MTTEEKRLEKIADVLWHNGWIGGSQCRAALKKARINPDNVTDAEVHRAQEMNRERMRQNFASTNSNPNTRLRTVIVGNSELDPDLNPNHPVRGAAYRKLQAEALAKAAKIEQRQTTNNSAATVTETSKPEKEPKHKAKITLLGFKLTDVLNRLGVEGFTVEQATKVVEHYGIECSALTVKGQVGSGKRGKAYGGVVPAPLTTKQLKELRMIAK